MFQYILSYKVYRQSTTAGKHDEVLNPLSERGIHLSFQCGSVSPLSIGRAQKIHLCCPLVKFQALGLYYNILYLLLLEESSGLYEHNNNILLNYISATWKLGMIQLMTTLLKDGSCVEDYVYEISALRRILWSCA